MSEKGTQRRLCNYVMCIIKRKKPLKKEKKKKRVKMSERKEEEEKSRGRREKRKKTIETVESVWARKLSACQQVGTPTSAIRLLNDNTR